MKTILNESLDPRYNLALEEYVLKELPTKEDFIFLWQNANSVIIGRNQNTIEEVNAQYVKEQNVSVVRRITGGGAVYHDMGNLNFSFVTNTTQDNINNYRKFTDPVIQALKSYGVPAEFGGRNDILVEGMKVSGNAQSYHKHRFLHHGTILVDADLTMLGKILKPKPDKVESKGIKSVRARVTNIKPYLKAPVPMKEFKERLLRYLLGSDNIKPYIYTLTAQDQKRIQALVDTKYSRWEWNYGESPAFTIEKYGRYEGGGITFRLQVIDGKVTQAKIYGDFLGTKDIAELEAALKGLNFNAEAFKSKLATLDVESYFYKITLDNVLSCLFQ